MGLGKLMTSDVTAHVSHGLAVGLVLDSGWSDLYTCLELFRAESEPEALGMMHPACCSFVYEWVKKCGDGMILANVMVLSTASIFDGS